MTEDTIEWGVMRSVRFSKDIDEWVTKRAKDNMRSINSEIMYILSLEKEREAATKSD